MLCNPFGEEAARAHRIYRVLASQLERKGYPTLRFDYSGTGDSSGDASGVTVSGWVDDIGTAVGELTERCAAKKTVLFGLALGGALAALATQGRRVRHLLLWDPVVDGRAYLSGLVDSHRAYMKEEMGSAYVDRLRLSSDGAPREVLGMPISDELAASMRDIDLRTTKIDAEQVTIITTAPLSPAQRAWREALPPIRTRWVEMKTRVPWNSDAALNDAVVPMDVVQSLVERVVEVSP